MFAYLLLLLLLLYGEPSEYCRNENAFLSPSFPRGNFPKLSRPLFGNPAISLSSKETHSFAPPPHDGFAFIAEHPRRCARFAIISKTISKRKDVCAAVEVVYGMLATMYCGLLSG
jgi:hypothetical protein